MKLEDTFIVLWFVLWAAVPLWVMFFSWRNNQKLERIMNKMSELENRIVALTAEVANNTTVIGSAITLINGFAAQLAEAIAAALAQGATPEQLAALDALNTSLNTNAADLAAAVAANIPPAP